MMVPRLAKQLLANPDFVLTSPVVRMKTTNWVTRLILPKWAIKYTVTIDDERISVEDLVRIADTAGVRRSWYLETKIWSLRCCTK